MSKSATQLRGTRIAIVYPQVDFASNPTLTAVAEELQSSGAEVSVILPAGSDVRDLPGVVCFPFCPLWTFQHGGVGQRLTRCAQWVNAKLQEMLHRQMYNQFDCIIGVNSEGIIQADRLARRFRVPTVYFSFEIFFREEITHQLYIQEKEKEIQASRRAALVLVQDRRRGALLAMENGLDPARFAYMPVSPRGPAQFASSDWLRDKLAIPIQSTIVLHSGAFCHWTFAEELLECTRSWPETLTLVVHTSSSSGTAKKYCAMVERGRYPRARIHTGKLSAAEYEMLVASADVGLALYKPCPPSRYEQKNLQHIGFASGKFSYYAKHGLPIISARQEFFAQLLRDYNFGAVVQSFDDLAAAVERIHRNRSCYSKEARRLFTEKLAFENHWPNFAQRLCRILQKSPC